MKVEDLALLALGRELKRADYRFITPTPATHARVLSRRSEGCLASLQTIFGWNIPFQAHHCPPAMLDLLAQGEALDREGDLLRSKVRYSTIGDQIFVHSGFPTKAHDAVFFGPDTYRFVRALKGAIGALKKRDGLRVIDIGCGSGAGGLFCASQLGDRVREIVLADINPEALRYAASNTALSGIANVSLAQSDGLANVQGDGDLIITNPPYLIDDEERLYRHGGEEGIALALRFTREALDRLAPGGMLVVYTGTPVIEGVGRFHAGIHPELEARKDLSATYEEIDPDVFGEELERPVYASTDRIAAVLLTVRKEPTSRPSS